MWTPTTPFAPPGTRLEIEDGEQLTPRFGSDGLVTAVVTDHATGQVLMVAHMNAEALARTLASGQAWYWSRSRGALWRKGETSGNSQEIVAIRVDCDQDALWLEVRQKGPACHTFRHSCFYRRVVRGDDGAVRLVEEGDGRR